MNSTRVTGNHGAYWLMNPSRIMAARKLRWRMMKYGNAATHGRLAHQIDGLPRFDMREISGWPVKTSVPRPEYSAQQRTRRARKGDDHGGETSGWVATRCA